MQTGKLLKTATALLFATASLWAVDVAVFPPNTTNLSSQQGDAIGEVMASQYAKVSQKSVTGPVQSRGYLDGQNNDLNAAAKAMGATEYIFMNAISLDAKIIIEAILYTQNGSEQYRSQMTAISLDDMPDVTDRLSRSLLYRQAPEQTRNLDNITEEETEEQNRMAMERVSGFKCGFSGAVMNSESIDPLASFGYNMKLESKRYFIEFGASALIPTDMDEDLSYGGVMFEIGADYYLTENPYVSPYIGGGVSPRILFSPGGIGIAPYAQFGLMFMRLSRTRIYTDIRISQNVAPVEITTYNWDPSNYEDSSTKTRYFPTEICLEVGIGW